MKLREIISSRAIHFVTFNNVATGSVYGPEALKKIQTRYQFIETANLVEFVTGKDPTKPVVFKHGRFSADQGNIVIRTFEYYQNGILAECDARVEDADAFLRDVANWVAGEFGQEIRYGGKDYRVYQSELEIQFKNDPIVVSPAFQKAIDLTNASLFGYGIASPFKPTGMHAGIDVMRYPPSTNRSLSPLLIERRANRRFEDNLFFSRAPLSTADHLSVLQAFEAEHQ